MGISPKREVKTYQHDMKSTSILSSVNLSSNHHRENPIADWWKSLRVTSVISLPLRHRFSFLLDIFILFVMQSYVLFTSTRLWVILTDTFVYSDRTSDLFIVRWLMSDHVNYCISDRCDIMSKYKIPKIPSLSSDENVS